MVEIEKVEEMLEKLAEELPREFYKELNGGILLLPETKMNPLGKRNDLYTMGEYHRNTSMGRYIVIYYGSFNKLYGHLSEKAFEKKLRATLRHEFVHHLESLAGERALEKKDEEFIKEYLRKNS